MLIQKIWIMALFALTIAGLFFISRSTLAQIACEGQPINFRIAPTVAQQIWGENIIGQTFVAPRDNLNRIDIMFQTYQRHNTGQVNIRLSEIQPDNLQPVPGTEPIDFTFNAAELQDQAWRSFIFPPIPDSARKGYMIMIRSPESAFDNAITVGGIEWDVYEPGLAFFGKTPVRADIAFRTCYQMTTFEKLQVLIQQLTHNRPALWGNGIFYGVILFIYSLLLIGLFWQLTRLVL